MELIKYVLRDEKLNIFMMTVGCRDINIPLQIMICKNKKQSKNLTGEPVLLYMKKTRPVFSNLKAVSNMGKYVQENIYDVGLNYIAYLDTQIKIKPSQQLFERLNKRFFLMWNPSATMEFYKSKEDGYIQVYRVYELESSIPYNTIANGSKGKNSLFYVRDEAGNVGYKVEIKRAVINDDDFHQLKNDLLYEVVSSSKNLSFQLSIVDAQKLYEEIWNKEIQDDLLIKEDKPVINYLPKAKSGFIDIGNQIVYKRNKVFSKNAILLAEYKCEVDERHITFIKRNSGIPYTEPHHFIPMSRC